MTGKEIDMEKVIVSSTPLSRSVAAIFLTPVIVFALFSVLVIGLTYWKIILPTVILAAVAWRRWRK